MGAGCEEETSAETGGGATWQPSTTGSEVAISALLTCQWPSNARNRTVVGRSPNSAVQRTSARRLLLFLYGRSGPKPLTFER